MPIALINRHTSASAERKLNILGYTTLRLPSADFMDEPLASHPDMLLCKCFDTIVTSSRYCEIAPYVFTDLREYSSIKKLCFTEEEPKRSYPHDAIFNALIGEEIALIKSDTVSRTLIDLLIEKGIKAVHTNQGYPACTTLLFGGSAITADRGVERTLRENGINVTLIENGGISLLPYEYGFIGGTAGVHNKRIFFYGDPMLHPSGEKIVNAIKDAGYEWTALSDEPLRDLGGIIFID